jgi:hypothetical protein
MILAVAITVTAHDDAHAYSKYKREQRSDWFNKHTLTLHTTTSPSQLVYKAQLLASAKYTYKHKPGHKAKVKVRNVTFCMTFTNGHLPAGEGTPGGLIGIDFTSFFHDNSGKTVTPGEVLLRYRADAQTCQKRVIPKADRVWMKMTKDPNWSVLVQTHFRISPASSGYMVGSADGDRRKYLLPAYDHPGTWGVKP